jgi:hypothetical protein
LLRGRSGIAHFLQIAKVAAVPRSSLAFIKSVTGTSVALACIVFGRTAYGFFDPPYLTPALPAAGDTVSVNIHDGICDGIIGIPGYPQITQNGSSIRILLWSASYTDPILCNIPEGTGTYVVGSYPPGSYTLQVDREYFGDVGEILTETLGVIPLTVAGGGAQPIALPASNAVSLVVLGFMLFVVARTKLYRAFLTDRQGVGYAP